MQQDNCFVSETDKGIILRLEIKIAGL